jgi:hypothetical protein
VGSSSGGLGAVVGYCRSHALTSSDLPASMYCPPRDRWWGSWGDTWVTQVTHKRHHKLRRLLLE